MPQIPLVAVVNDDDPSRDAVVGLIRALGFATADFSSAADLLNSDHLSRTKCLVADLRMPRMSGLELHRHLVASGIQISTILMTAYPDDLSRAQALKEGVQCYLAKPCKVDELLSCIRAAFAEKEGEQS